MSLLSPSFVRSFSFTSSLQKKRNVNNKNARGHVTLFFILSFFLFFLRDERKKKFNTSSIALSLKNETLTITNLPFLSSLL